MEKSGSTHYNMHRKIGKNNVGKLISATSIFAITASFGLAMSPINAMAQDNNDNAKVEKKADEDVVVVGIRKSLRKSIAIKRLNQSVVEVATAEDIGKLPGVSITETLARLPGVAAQRVDGRAQVISIRGMAPAFSVTLLNGQEMVSTGDDRVFEYDQFPAELVTQAMVYKTPDAALGTQGLAGTVNLNTVSPLVPVSKKFNISARAEANSYKTLVPGSKSTGSRFSASYIDQFADGKLGVALGYTRLDTATNKKYFNPWDFGPADWWPVVGVPANQMVYDGFEAGVMNWQGARDSLMGVVEYKPNDNFTSKLSVFHSQFDQKMNGREFAAVIGDWGLGNVSTSVTTNNGVNGLTVINVAPSITMRKDNRDDKIDQANWANTFNVNGWELHADLGFSKVKRNQTTYEVYAATKDPVTINANIRSGFDSFGNVTSSYNFGNPANFNYASYWWGGGGGYIQYAKVTDEMKNARFSAKHDFKKAIFKDIEAGFIYSDRTKNVNYEGVNQFLKTPIQTNCLHYYDWDSGSGCAAIPSSILQSNVDLGFAGLGQIISFDALAALQGSAFVADSASSKNQNWNWEVGEKITTFYVKAGLDFNPGVPVTGNVGLQAVHVDQASIGTNDQASGTQAIVNIGSTYTDYLPSLNLTADIGDGLYLKVAAAKVSARPPMQYMRANFTATVVAAGVPKWVGSGGNPKLRPWKANAYDISLEKYFSKGTYLAVAGFYKDLTSGIVQSTIDFDFTGFHNPTSIIPASTIGTLTAPANVKSGYIRGIEISGAAELSMISPILDGFGLTASYSNTQSNIKGTNIYGVPTDMPLEGLSGKVMALQAYYEKDGWQLRVGDRYRSKFSAARHNSFKNVIDTILPENIVDLQAGYTFQDGPLKDLNILLQVDNLTDEPYVTTQTANGVEALKEFHKFGRQYYLGFSYKF